VEKRILTKEEFLEIVRMVDREMDKKISNGIKGGVNVRAD
jgi:hypothetical protein